MIAVGGPPNGEFRSLRSPQPRDPRAVEDWPQSEGGRQDEKSRCLAPEACFAGGPGTRCLVGADVQDGTRRRGRCHRDDEQVAPELQSRGIVFAGLDVIGDWLTEVNVTSPTGIQELGRLTGTKPEEDFIAWVEEKVGELDSTDPPRDPAEV